jgi:hypothetical protein
MTGGGFMPRSILRFLTLGIVCAAGAFGQQGTFAQIAYGGSWQTTFTLLNRSSTNVASVSLSFFADDGSPLNAPVQGFGNATSYTFPIPAGGAQNVVLSSSDSTVTQGWATMNVSGDVRGQGSFRFLLPGGQISEAVVPLSNPGAVLCLIPIPPSPNPVILMPFDNTSGQYVTSLAIANTTSGALPISIEFVDQSNNQLASDTLNLTAMQHTAFVTRQNYPAVDGKKGTLRIHASASSVTVLGLLSNVTNAITTIMPVTQ